MRKYNRLYIWVEGKDDKNFFESIIKRRFERVYGRGQVSIRRYSEMSKEKVVGFIKSFKERGDDCIAVADIDKAPCVSKRKGEIQKEKLENVDKNSMIIVIREIEGWYLAGLDDDACEEVGIDSFDNTDEVTKGRFNNLWRKSKRAISEIVFRQEILEHFDMETAKRKNKSFGYFVGKYDLQSIWSVDNGT